MWGRGEFARFDHKVFEQSFELHYQFLMAHRLEVDKFTRKHNFSLWQRKVRALLSQYDTMDALEGIEKKS